MNTFARTVVAAAFLLPGMVLAEASDFNYVEGSFLQGEVEELDIEGFGINGSFELTDRFFVEAGYDEVELDEDNFLFDADVETMNIGIGYIFGENETGNFYGTLNYINTEISFGNASDDDSGYALGLGTRFNLGPQAEVRAQLDYVDVANDDDFVPSVALVYSFTSQFAGVAEYTRNDSNSHLFGLGVRYYFR